MTDTILEARGLGKRFGKFQALSEINATFRANELCAIIGPNGAGKSTFFNILSGAFAPTSGRVLFRGEDVTGLPQHGYARRGIAKSFQITNVFKQLSAHENVRVAVQMPYARFDFLRPRSALHAVAERADALLERVGLAPLRNKTAAGLAHGQQRALEMAMALAAERTVILVEHKMKLVMGICERLIVLHHGEVLAEGSPQEIRANAEVRRVYLGQG